VLAVGFGEEELEVEAAAAPVADSDDGSPEEEDCCFGAMVTIIFYLQTRGQFKKIDKKQIDRQQQRGTKSMLECNSSKLPAENK